MRVVSAWDPMVECSYHQNLTESRRVDRCVTVWVYAKYECTVATVQCTVYCTHQPPPSPLPSNSTFVCCVRLSIYWGIKLENIS